MKIEPYSVLSLEGADVKDFLNRVTSADLNAFNSFLAYPIAMLSLKGKILFCVNLIIVDEKFYMLVRSKNIDFIIQCLEKYKLFEDFRLVKSEISCVWRYNKANGQLFRDSRGEELGGFELCKPSTFMCTEDLEKQHSLLIEHGIMEFGVDYDSNQFHEHEIGLQRLGAVSVKKGCYPGQEVVSRMYHLGKSKTSLILLNGDFESNKTGLTGLEVYLEGERCGFSGRINNKRCLAVVRNNPRRKVVDKGYKVGNIECQLVRVF